MSNVQMGAIVVPSSFGNVSIERSGAEPVGLTIFQCDVHQSYLSQVWTFRMRPSIIRETGKGVTFASNGALNGMFRQAVWLTLRRIPGE